MVSIMPETTLPTGKKESTKRNNVLQLEDIYNSLERRCASSRSQSTGALIHASREYLIYKRPLLPRRTDGHHTLSLPPMSRPGTRLGSDVSSQRPPSAKTLDCRTLQVALARSGAISPNVCMRAQSAVDRQIEDVVRPLSRHCCDVLGPHHCYQCNQINRQEKDLTKNEAKYPLLHVSNDNITTTTVAERYMPDMNPYQIQHKVASGEIAKPSCRERFIRAKSSSDQRSSKPKENPKKKAMKVLAKRRESAYFTNIRDLNIKIISGEVSNKISQKIIMGKRPTMQKKQSLASFTEQLCPMFISPKKNKAPEKPSYIAYYEPPLLPKVCQNAEPSFFAGSDSKYKLPDRLPDNLGSEETAGAKDVWN